MNKFENEKGFTLAELLVVVAIIGVLVAISIPIFTSQLEKARETTDLANVRSAYAQVRTAAMMGDDGIGDVKKSGSSYYITVSLKQKQDDWQKEGTLSIGGVASDDMVHWISKPKAQGACKLTVLSDGSTYINWDASIISMIVEGEKAKYAPTLNAILNTLKNTVVDERLMSEQLHVSYIQINDGIVKSVQCYKSPTDVMGQGSSKLTAEQYQEINDQLKETMNSQNYKFGAGCSRIFFDYDGNVVSGLDENGKPIKIGGQGTNASVIFKDSGNKTLNLKEETWK